MKKTILIVEDDRLLREALEEKFRKADFDVVAAENGKTGLELALAGHPDLILLDVMMPVMSGEDMLKKLREDDWGEKVSVIMLTNVSFMQDEDTRTRTDEYLLKADTKLDDLVEKVKSKLG